MPRVSSELLNKSETLMIAHCIVRRDGSDLSPSFFFKVPYSMGRVKWHISSVGVKSRDVLRF